MSTATVHAYGPDASQYLRFQRPAGHMIGTAILIHGGYWRDRYGLGLMDPMVDHLVASGWEVANIEYRRLAEPDAHRPGADRDGIWPEMSSDVLSAIHAVNEPRDGAPDPTRRHGPDASAGPVVAIGHSAGGHLALWAGATSSGIDAVVALAPVADLVAADRLSLSDGVVRRLLGADSTARPDLYRAASPRALLPLGLPQLIVHGGADDAVPQEIGIAYATAATDAGDEVELLAPADVDHFHIIDPDHPVWETIDHRLTRFARTRHWS